MIPAALDWCEACGQNRRWWCPACGFVFCRHPTCRIHGVPHERPGPDGAPITVCRVCARQPLDITRTALEK